MVLDGRPIWLTSDPLAMDVRTITAAELPYGGLPVRYLSHGVDPVGIDPYAGQPVRLAPGQADAQPIWDVESPPL